MVALERWAAKGDAQQSAGNQGEGWLEEERAREEGKDTQTNEYSGTTQVSFYPTSGPTNYDMETKVTCLEA